MGDQEIICEVPCENVLGENCENPMQNHQTTCYQQQVQNIPCSQMPCETPMSYEPCQENPTTCDCCCNMDSCYQQPPRQPMCKPEVNYILPTGPMENDTIYKRSFMGTNGSCRAVPIRLKDTIKPFEGPMDSKTIQKLSFQPHCGIARVQPILPRSNGLKFEGPSQDITSQKHDFVPKCYSKRNPLKAPDGIFKRCEPLEKCTVNKLSFMPYNICNNPPPKPIIQTGSYCRPDAPGESCTIQKLSYMPVPLPERPDMPWAKQIRVAPPPSGSMCTTYKLSYIPNCNPQRVPTLMPVQAIKIFGSDMPDKNTVYKLSYLQSCGTKPNPIVPRPGIHLPTGPFEKCTVYKLSYLPQSCLERVKPIRPRENVCKSNAPIQGITTQKHDFVPKSCQRRNLIVPPTSMCTPSGPMEKCTINKLSYLPLSNPIKSSPILPRPGLCKIDAPISKCTTYKLSYMPVQIPVKEKLPWAKQTSCVRSTAPMERCTIQKLSYAAPGKFVKKTNCGCCCANKSGPMQSYPKAAVCG